MHVPCVSTARVVVLGHHIVCVCVGGGCSIPLAMCLGLGRLFLSGQLVFGSVYPSVWATGPLVQRPAPR